MESEYVLLSKPTSLKLYLKGSLILLLIIILPLQLIMSEALQNAESEILYKIQSSMISPGLTWIGNIFLYIGRPNSLCVIGPVLYHMMNPRFGIKVIMVNCLIIYVQCITKMIYCEPRPYWVNDKIEGLGCERGYGSPSNQVVFALTGYVYILANIDYKDRWVIKSLAMIVAILINAMIFFFEIYLGDQFIHQIFISICYAWIYLVISISLDSYINRLVFKSAVDYTRSRSYIVYWFLITMGLLTFSIFIFSMITSNRPVSVLWISNAKNYCELTFDLGSSYTFFHTSFIFYNLGVISGSLYTHSYFGEFWYETGMITRAIRSLISLVMTGFIWYLFCKIYIDNVPSVDTPTRFVFNNVIPLYLIGFFFTGSLPYIGFYTKLINLEEAHAHIQ